MNLTSRTLLTLSSFSGQFVQCIGVEDDGRFLSGEKGVWFSQEVTPSLQIVNQSQHLGKIKFYERKDINNFLSDLFLKIIIKAKLRAH